MPAAKNPARGSDLPQSKLTKQIVSDIRIRASMGVNHARMANQYRVHVNTVQRIVSYANWWHL